MKKYLITGLLIWIPLAITIWVLELIVTTMDQSLLLLPPQYQPQVLLGHQIPGLVAVLTVVVVFVIMMPKAEVIELDMSVDDALRYVISMGVAAPDLPGARKS